MLQPNPPHMHVMLDTFLDRRLASIPTHIMGMHKWSQAISNSAMAPRGGPATSAVRGTSAATPAVAPIAVATKIRPTSWFCQSLDASHMHRGFA